MGKPITESSKSTRIHQLYHQAIERFPELAATNAGGFQWYVSPEALLYFQCMDDYIPFEPRAYGPLKQPAGFYIEYPARLYIFVDDLLGAGVAELRAAISDVRYSIELKGALYA